MANRRIEMYEYRQVIHRMRQGQSDRAIAKTRLMGRTKCTNSDFAAVRNKQFLHAGSVPSIWAPCFRWV